MAIPKEICDREPELKNIGVYRKLNNGKYELVSFCAPEFSEYLTMWKGDFEKLAGFTYPRPTSTPTGE
jgi:hypothetical protein